MTNKTHEKVSQQNNETEKLRLKIAQMAADSKSKTNSVDKVSEFIKTVENLAKVELGLKKPLKIHVYYPKDLENEIDSLWNKMKFVCSEAKYLENINLLNECKNRILTPNEQKRINEIKKENEKYEEQQEIRLKTEAYSSFNSGNAIYSPDTHSIALNGNYLDDMCKNNSLMQIATTVFHEMRHAWQHEFPEKSGEDVENYAETCETVAGRNASFEEIDADLFAKKQLKLITQAACKNMNSKDLLKYLIHSRQSYIVNKYRMQRHFRAEAIVNYVPDKVFKVLKRRNDRKLRRESFEELLTNLTIRSERRKKIREENRQAKQNKIIEFEPTPEL